MACALAGAAPAAASSPTGSPQIVGGTEADISQYPWQVALELNDQYWQGTARERFACGGVLIGPRTVLTAAHCVYDTPVGGIGFNAGNQFEAITGHTNISGAGSSAIDVSGVRYLVTGADGAPVLEERSGTDKGPQLYNPTTYSWDMAVLTLTSESSAKPIQIAGPNETATWSAGRTAATSGWGSVDPNDATQLANHLKAVQLRIVGDDRCAATWPAYFSSLDRVCADSPHPGNGSCRGDSGGGLVVPVEVGNALSYRLVGLTNFGPVPCAAAPTMFTRVAGAPIRNTLGSGAVGSGARPLEPPQTLITKRPPHRTRKRKARFAYVASEPALFFCKLDHHHAKLCGPKFSKRVGRGRHRFEVWALDSLRQRDPNPARYRWRVRGKHGKHHHHHHGHGH